MVRKSVRCIKIVHLPLEVKKYRVLSAFFRFVGIFACENLYGDEYGDDVDYVYRIEEGSEEAEVTIVQWIQDALSEMKEVFGEEACGALKRIGEIFSKYDLMRASYGNAYFGDTGVGIIYQRMESAMEKFRAALEELERLEQEYLSDRLYIWAAKASCKRRINEIFTIIWDAIEENRYGEDEAEKKELRKTLKANHHYYQLDEVKEDISKILEADPEFYGAYAILAFVAEIDDYHEMEAEEAFEQAIRVIGHKSYASYLYLRLERYLSRMYLRLEDDITYYRKAYAADPHNFRAGYRLAVYEQDSDNDDGALEMWNDLLRILEPKRDLPSLQPVECAYLYKIYRNIGNLYNRKQEYSKAIKYLRKAESVYQSKSNEDSEKGFYPWMFGKEKVADCNGTVVEIWEVYKQAAKAKLKIEKTYADIVYASGRANQEEIYDHYLALA